MKRQIRKLNELKHTDSFMQINFLRGFKYIDRAGEIMNSFYKESNEPPYRMEQRQLIVKYAPDDPKTYRIAVDNVWYHDADPNNLGQLSDSFRQKIQELLGITEVTEVTRTGWRNYFICELSDEQEKKNILTKAVPSIDTELAELRFQKTFGEFSCSVNIRGATKTDEKKTPAIIFDVDCFRTFDNPVDASEAGSQFDQMRKLLQSDQFLMTFNNFLKAGQ